MVEELYLAKRGVCPQTGRGRTGASLAIQGKPQSPHLVVNKRIERIDHQRPQSGRRGTLLMLGLGTYGVLLLLSPRPKSPIGTSVSGF